MAHVVSDDTDPFLEYWVAQLERLADQGDEPRVPVTLLVGGTLFTGTLVPAQSWMQHRVAGLRADDVIDREIAEAAAQTFEEQRKLAESDTRDGASVYYVHLLEARPVGMPGDAHSVVPMRIKLSDVSGWVLGAPEEP